MTSRETSGKPGTMTAAARAVVDHAAAVRARLAKTDPARDGRWACSIATAAIHLDLYVTGYRTIPTIGWLFLLQIIAAFVLGLAVLVIPGRPSSPAGGGGRAASPSLPSAATC